jgi:AbrB family looped-hinge helix DNA binding protein
MATSVKMSSKHQIVVPKEAREALGLEPGDRLVVTVRGDGVLEMEPQPQDLVEELGGLLSSVPDAGAPAPGGAGRGDDLWPELRDA